ncbi:hypothetical protein [Methanococcoides alaskense]|uniref:Uncharacterized protein n=1 Tax=Methanococcoides alaskense TaxID=325778 RepID=A0AA90Z5W7_9EURY|nr:hypothetical protein [Methanococcoides alaskense]MDA0525379.1 hypothetical protein [Methanococcoides alaskense]MDR6221690.1 hypothetical protein [Methanococcoides alaskense]
MEKKSIEIFVSGKEQSDAGCGCSCNCESADTMMPTDLSVNFGNGDYEMTFNVKMIEVEKENREDLIARLNTIFENSGEKLTVKDINLDFTLSKLLPLIVESGKIRAAKTFPDENELSEAINSDGRVKVKSGCC